MSARQWACHLSLVSTCHIYQEKNTHVKSNLEVFVCGRLATGLVV